MVSGKKNNFSALVLIYNSFNDPLFQNIVLSYLKNLSSKGSYGFYLVTFEQKKYFIPEEEIMKIRSELESQNIHWFPLTYHSGQLILLKKLYDFLCAFFMILFIKIRYNPKVLFSFTNIAASLGVIFSKLFGFIHLIYSYEPHSEFMAELGVWKRSGLKYKLLNSLEKYAGLNSDYVLTGTKFMVKRLEKEGSRAQVYRAPTSVNETEFQFREEGRKAVREELNIDGRNVLLYIGKFGDLYYRSEIADLCLTIQKSFPDFFFLIVTSNDQEEIRNMFRGRGIHPANYFVTGDLSYDEIKNYISAADVGLSAVAPGPSQCFRSPTKVAEYLLCGLPYITCRGVSEDDLVAMEFKVGLVVDDFSERSVSGILEPLGSLMTENRSELRLRCRETGIQYRGQQNINRLLEGIFSEIGSK